MSIDKLTMGLAGAFQNVDISKIYTEKGSSISLQSVLVGTRCDYAYFSIMMVKFMN